MTTVTRVLPALRDTPEARERASYMRVSLPGMWAAPGRAFPHTQDTIVKPPCTGPYVHDTGRLWSVQRVVGGPGLELALDRVDKSRGIPSVEQPVVERDVEIHH